MQQILLICLRLDFQHIAVSLRAKYGSIHVTVSFSIKILQLQLRKIILSPSTAEGDTRRTQKLECQVIFYHRNKKHKRWEDGKTKKNSLVFAFYKLETKKPRGGSYTDLLCNLCPNFLLLQHAVHLWKRSVAPEMAFTATYSGTTRQSQSQSQQYMY